MSNDSGAHHRPAGSSGHRHDHSHRHSHGIVDRTIATTDRGMWAFKWSFLGPLATALLQLGVVVISGSVALLADTIHNFADAATAIPLAIAFAFARVKPSRRFPYGYGRVEDLAGVLIVLTMLVTVLIAGYESMLRLLRPQPVGHLWAVAGASVIGCLGNEAVSDVAEVRAGWIGHRLTMELNVAVNADLSVTEGHGVAKEIRHRILHQVPHVSGVTVHVDPATQSGETFHGIDGHAHDGLPIHSHR